MLPAEAKRQGMRVKTITICYICTSCDYAMMDSNLRKKLNLNPDKMKEQLRMALSE